MVVSKCYCNKVFESSIVELRKFSLPSYYYSVFSSSASWNSTQMELLA